MSTRSKRRIHSEVALRNQMHGQAAREAQTHAFRFARQHARHLGCGHHISKSDMLVEDRDYIRAIDLLRSQLNGSLRWPRLWRKSTFAE